MAATIVSMIGEPTPQLERLAPVVPEGWSTNQLWPAAEYRQEQREPDREPHPHTPGLATSPDLVDSIPGRDNVQLRRRRRPHAAVIAAYARLWAWSSRPQGGPATRPDLSNHRASADPLSLASVPESV